VLEDEPQKAEDGAKRPPAGRAPAKPARGLRAGEAGALIP